MPKQTTGLKRNTIDKFYTSLKIVKICIELIKNTIDINDNDLCIEPSAGNGSFINDIKKLFMHYRFYDIEPEHTDIKKINFLEFSNSKHLNSEYRKIHIVGNPPFGRQSSLAIKFIKTSAKFCDTISFILPKSFKKDSLKKHFPLNFHLVCELDLQKNAFVVDENEYDVPTVFQIWIKKDINRIVRKKLVPNNFKFVKKEENHDISFRRVGINAGTIDVNTEEKSPQSHYFIKFDIERTDTLLYNISNINYNCKDNTCGPKSISKQELIHEFNIMFQK